MVNVSKIIAHFFDLFVVIYMPCPESFFFGYRLLEVQYLLVVIKSICPTTTVASWSLIWTVLCLVLQWINIKDIANIINKHLVAMVIKSICPSTEAASLTQYLVRFMPCPEENVQAIYYLHFQLYGTHSPTNKLAKFRRHASWLHFAKIHLI